MGRKEGSNYVLEPSGFEIPQGAKLLFGDNEYLHHGRIQKHHHVFHAYL
jgi:hypothetical protein